MAPANIDSLKEIISELCGPVVVVTSGGTSVPLEKNMVRFLDNFRSVQRPYLESSIRNNSDNSCKILEFIVTREIIYGLPIEQVLTTYCHTPVLLFLPIITTVGESVVLLASSASLLKVRHISWRGRI